MPKLLVAIVHADDSDAALEALREEGFRATRLASVGGLLGATSTTFLVGVDDADEDRAVAVFERVCSRRELEVPLVLLGRLRDHLPRFVAHAGANIFVLDVVRQIRAGDEPSRPAP